MAEDTASVGLNTSIALLIDIGTNIAAQLDDFASKTAHVPESLRSLSKRLPLLLSTLQLITQQTRAISLPSDAITAVHSLVRNTLSQISIVDRYVSEITPPTDASRIQRAVKTLQGLTKQKNIRVAVERIHRDIDLLVFHQTSRHADGDNRVLDALSQLQRGQSRESSREQNQVRPYAVHHGHSFPNVTANEMSHVHLGDVYYMQQNQQPSMSKIFGLCLASAPLINVDEFVGRTAELENMAQRLRPGEPAVEQRRMVLGGMGGIGKTQLAIAYARQYSTHYTSVLWLNATSELTLNANFQSIVQQLLIESDSRSPTDEEARLIVLRWLSDTSNKQWLLIFDNHDEPHLYSIANYIPNIAHGSVIITTRVPDLLRGQRIPQLRVPIMDSLDESLQILQTRSQRDNLKNDPAARRLAERLAGLPLALATSGAYLRKTTLTFDQYLRVYEQQFDVSSHRPSQLQEYDRTMSTTWNLSYSQIESDSPLAANLLKLLAYLDNQDVWFELLHAGLGYDSPQWLQEVATEQIDFENTMGTLVDYCLVEVHTATRSYSMHNCVHDWTLAELNKTIDPQLYWYALDCVKGNLDKKDWDALVQQRYARLNRHGERLTHSRFEQIGQLSHTTPDQLGYMIWVARLLLDQSLLPAAEQMYLRIISWCDISLGPDSHSKFIVYNSLSLLYRRQGKLDDAEKYSEQALTWKEKELGPDHASTLVTLNSLGLLYRDQGKLDKAEQMHVRALAGKEKLFGPNHTATLLAVDNLGIVYQYQGKLDKAEELHTRALTGYENLVGPNHPSTLMTVHNIGLLYYNQGRRAEAERMYRRALAGSEKLVGPSHPATLQKATNLGALCQLYGKPDEAEVLLKRALVGYQKAYGPDHSSTVGALRELNKLYRQQGRPEVTE